MFINHPLYKKAYLHYEIEQICQNFCLKLELENPVIQVTFKKNIIVLTIKLNSSSEGTALKLKEYDLFEKIEETLKEKSLWDEGREISLVVKLK
jgi:hypothetical protein